VLTPEIELELAAYSEIVEETGEIESSDLLKSEETAGFVLQRSHNRAVVRFKVEALDSEATQPARCAMLVTSEFVLESSQSKARTHCVAMTAIFNLGYISALKRS